MKKLLILSIAILLVIAGGVWWLTNKDGSFISYEQASEQMKKDIPLLQGTTVTINRNDGRYFSFGSSDGYGSVWGIAKLEEDGSFKLLLTGQEAPSCGAFPQEIPTTLLESCYEGNELRSR